MSSTDIIILEENIGLNDPIFIEALPGIGHVGKLAADHMIDEFDGVKFAEIYSNSFPPQVLVREGGIIEAMSNELYYIKNVGEDNLDLVLLVGNTQALSPEGQYESCKSIFNYIYELGVKKIITLGGFPTGQTIEKPRILGAATCEENIEVLKELDIEIRSNDGGIVGASGIFLSLGSLYGVQGSCLMGETPGYFIDASAAEAMLGKLSQLLNFEIDTDELEQKAEETKEMLAKAQKMEQDILNQSSSDVDDLRYIG